MNGGHVRPSQEGPVATESGLSADFTLYSEALTGPQVAPPALGQAGHGQAGDADAVEEHLQNYYRIGAVVTGNREVVI